MSRPLVVRTFFVLILCVVLVAPSVFAAGGSVEGDPGPAWFEWLLSTFSALWGDNGCMPDSNGGCAEATNADNGCRADPNGGCSH